MKKFFLQHWHYLFIIVPLFIFIYSIWDHNFYIGGDVMIPLNPVNNIQKIFLWDNGLESFKYAGFFWYAFYFLFSLVGIPAFVTQKILFVLLLIIGFAFTYLSYKELFKDTEYADNKLSFLAAVIFTFNPVYFLIVQGYLPLYGFPVCFYLLIKFLKKSRIVYSVLFAILVNFFFFIDLPQPKILIVFSIACLFLALLYRQIKDISFKSIFIRLVIVFLFTIILNLWVLIPMIYSFIFGAGSTFSKSLVTYGGDAEFKIASLLYISRFFNYNIIKYYPQLTGFLTSPVFVIWTFSQWIILLLGFFFTLKDRKCQKIIILQLIAILFFMFIAKGSNPPFGEIYRYIIINFPLGRIFRTTSSVVIGSVMFYSFLFSISIYYLTHLAKLFKWKKAIVYIIIFLNIVIFYPLYFGYKFYNDVSTAPEQKGFEISNQYYEMGDYLDNLKGDSKILPIPLIEEYVNKNWSYFGPDIISWITKKGIITKKPGIYVVGGYGPNVTNKKNIQISPETSSFFNVGYILLQKDTIGENLDKFKDLNRYLNRVNLLIRNDYFDLYKIKDEFFLPHFYIPQNIFCYDGEISELNNIFSSLDNKPRLVIYLASDMVELTGNITKIPFEQKNMPRITFVKVNPVKYRIKVEGAKDPYTLVFSENFNKGWRIYINELKPAINKKYYKEIEVSYFNEEIKEGTHKNIFFDKNTFETWDKKPIAENLHFIANGYANSWYIVPEDADGRENYEIIIEFWPQRLFYIGLAISAFTFLGCLCYLVYSLCIKKKRVKVKQVR